MSELRTVGVPTRVSSTGDYVLPKPPSGRDLPVDVVGRSAQAEERRRGEVARRLGERGLALAECQQQFLGELRERLLALESAIVDDSRARLLTSLRASIEVLDWCDAVQADLLAEASMTCQGWLPHDLRRCCDEVAQASGERVLCSGAASNPWWGEGTALAAALEAGIALVRERTAGRGPVRLEVGEGEAGCWVRIHGATDPAEDVEPATVRAFRAAVERLGAEVVPDELGPGGTGLILRLPARPA